MAVTQFKPKAVSKSSLSSKYRSSKDKAQMHKRSRTGCYTCRLRRKKCDEGTPACTACKHLGLTCNYSRPIWWADSEQRRVHKESIKLSIKRTKLAEKSTSLGNKIMGSRGATPLDISHSSSLFNFSNSHDRSRSASIDSQMSVFDLQALTPNTNYCLNDTGVFSEQTNYVAMYPDYFPVCDEDQFNHDLQIPGLSRYSESTISDFSSFQANFGSKPRLPLLNEDSGCNYNYLKDCHEGWQKNTPSESLFNMSHSTCSDMIQTPTHELHFSEEDLYFLEIFISDILPIAFPILDTNSQSSVLTNKIISMLQKNICYAHYCLSIAAQYFKASMQVQDEKIDELIMRHRDISISELCEALKRDSDHVSTLEAMLGMIIFQGSVGRLEDSLPGIPWHQHFQAAISLVHKLDLHRLVAENIYDQDNIPFNMTMTAWIDILGATMLGRAPIFAHTYREKHLSKTNSSLGLQALMGCDDHVLYLISEIACLETLRIGGMKNEELFLHVHALANQISLTESEDAGPSICFNTFGELLPKQLSFNVTAAFRIAARIYLCSLIPGFGPTDDHCVALIAKLTQILSLIPSGPTGFDRSLVWVYLIAGSFTTSDSPFRIVLTDRLRTIGDKAFFGCLGRVSCVLKEVWNQMDNCICYENTQTQSVSWRDVMQSMAWDFLLI